MSIFPLAENHKKVHFTFLFSHINKNRWTDKPTFKRVVPKYRLNDSLVKSITRIAYSKAKFRMQFPKDKYLNFPFTTVCLQKYPYACPLNVLSIAINGTNIGLKPCQGVINAWKVLPHDHLLFNLDQPPPPLL